MKKLYFIWDVSEKEWRVVFCAYFFDQQMCRSMVMNHDDCSVYPYPFVLLCLPLWVVFCLTLYVSVSSSNYPMVIFWLAGYAERS